MRTWRRRIWRFLRASAGLVAAVVTIGVPELICNALMRSRMRDSASQTAIGRSPGVAICSSKTKIFYTQPELQNDVTYKITDPGSGLSFDSLLVVFSSFTHFLIRAT